MNMYDAARREAVLKYGPMAPCDHGVPLADGCKQCAVTGLPVLTD